MVSHSCKIQDMPGDLALRVGNDQAVACQHAIRDHRKDNALSLTRPWPAKRQDTACRIFTIQTELAKAMIQPPFAVAPERAQEGYAVFILTAVAAILSESAKVRRSHCSTLGVRTPQAVYLFAQPAAVAQYLVQPDTDY